MPLVLLGIITSLLSYVTSFSITTEILRYNTNNVLENMNNLNINNNNNNNNKKNSKVKFNKYISVLSIPSHRSLSKNNLSEIWYGKDDYKKFKSDFILDINKSNSI